MIISGILAGGICLDKSYNKAPVQHWSGCHYEVCVTSILLFCTIGLEIRLVELLLQLLDCFTQEHIFSHELLYHASEVSFMFLEARTSLFLM